ncbi:MAG: hypothetical protein LC641_12470 [Spirochaeta sp.]|nr:hypothetical protein [Spirochaeta sp.]
MRARSSEFSASKPGISNAATAAFVLNLRAGKKAERAAVAEKHIGGMVAVIPLYAALRHLGQDDAAARRAVLSHVALTHADPLLPAAPVRS